MSEKSSTDATTEFQWRTLGRIDHYIGTTNAKAALLVAFDTFLLGGFALKAREVVDPLEQGSCAWWVAVGLVFAIGLLSVIGLVAALSSAQPILDSNSRPGEYHSRIFLSDIAAMKDAEAYSARAQAATPAETLDDLSRQVHVVATVANKKLKRLKVAARIAIFGQTPVLFALLVLGLFN